MKGLILFILMIYTVDSLAQTADKPNYDESKVPEYTLPELLKTNDGVKVNNKQVWEAIRRPELIREFEDNIYGQMPQGFDRITYSFINDNKSAMEGKARLKEVLIKVFNKDQKLEINLILFIPNRAKRPSPAFLLINNRGKENTDPTRINKSDFWPAELLIDSGYAIAAFNVDELAPDQKDTYMNGVLRLYPEQLAANNGMRAIGAWAWGASRVMDYLLTDPDIDGKQIAVVGHSRGGKASLWAAAEDQRFALCITNCSGNTGAALARRQFGERIKTINTKFPYWFSPNYKKFNDQEALLPVDQHMLISMIAPRPVYATNASDDLWADPKGTYLSLQNAEPAYVLYGIKPNLPANSPAINEPIVNASLAYHIREGKHDLTLFDWINFIKFANYNFKKRAF
ncbi:putative acetyl xylan esterase [Arcticibacter svalbardensis MN12-7]|uniref:Putative acetyl xylan esterase n=1 Tax=Arcticibacter svalbardensis MN12-7 TaxID=1150600 RepID=R9GLX2_9SPHI|nr:acetylxylan esterase [Arcticibacter svalbardensis]EOR92676.1 putative acetyl xylan esterase [Arcticibacter svalbardensis MN12-7]